MQIRRLDRAECVAFLERNRLGRLACISGGKPYAVPIHYAFHDAHLYAFSMPGKKIDALRLNPAASLLVEEVEGPEKWRTVAVEGVFEELPDRIGFKRQRDHAWQLLSRHASWWEPGSQKPLDEPFVGRPDHIFFRISVDTVSGRETSN